MQDETSTLLLILNNRVIKKHPLVEKTFLLDFSGLFSGLVPILSLLGTKKEKIHYRVTFFFHEDCVPATVSVNFSS